MVCGDLYALIILWDNKLKTMAEIHVESKKNQSTPAWIWILVSLAIIGLVAYFLTRDSATTNDQNTGTNTNNSSSYIAPAAVDGFLS
jgi:hypothetical protein